MIFPPRPCANHAFGDRLESEKQAFDVDGENLVVARFGDFDDRRHVEDAGVVDENVDPAPSLNYVLNRSLDGGCLCDVEREGGPLLAMTCGCLLGLSQGNVGDRNSRAFCDIAFGDRRADARAPPVTSATLSLSFTVVSSLASAADCVLVACVPLKTCPTGSPPESIARRAPRAPRAHRRTRGHSSDCPARSPKMWRNWRNAMRVVARRLRRLLQTAPSSDRSARSACRSRSRRSNSGTREPTRAPDPGRTRPLSDDRRQWEE